MSVIRASRCATAGFMRRKLRTVCLSLITAIVLCATPPAAAQTTATEGVRSYVIDNGVLRVTVETRGQAIAGDREELLRNGSRPAVTLATDADFEVNVMFTDWQAPGTINNAENPVALTKAFFAVERAEISNLPDGGRQLEILMKGDQHPILLRVVYELPAGKNYCRRSIAVRDTSFGHHFLRQLWPLNLICSDVKDVIHAGGFGQPIAVRLGTGGAFFGLENPVGENRSVSGTSGVLVRCGVDVGHRIRGEWRESGTAVVGLTPDANVKRHFFEYVDDIQIAAPRPFTLYNTWYDLRSPEYPRVPPENYMSERSSRAMAELLRTKMMHKYGIRLDAFVLDDGWDVYKSDWQLRAAQWPNGLKPLAEDLATSGTGLGIWYGPTGGYSFHRQRIGWMKEHGYEIVGDQMCVGGKNYHALLDRRVTDMVRDDSVTYFKWDGIQFSCSEPDHGHPIDVYSRTAIMDSVVTLCRDVRAVNPAVFLNITSGTWLSPWWVQYANTIWMQGEDYGYADVPSISDRDAAITYRDFVLYDDFRQKDLWFPMSNLMTHGIIKGKLELLGSPEESLDKFADDVVLYVARGIAMYELYVSPDILSEGEWRVLGESLLWARDRFPTLMRTDMIGGNPLRREAYGYFHGAGSRAILAARNPFIIPQTLNVDLTTTLGMTAGAHDLVIERVYPDRWVSPKLYAQGEKVELPLDGYETAIYELYPLQEAKAPLLAGAVFDETIARSGEYVFRFRSADSEVKLLNPRLVAGAAAAEQSLAQLVRDVREESARTLSGSVRQDQTPAGKYSFEATVEIPPDCPDAMLAILSTGPAGEAKNAPVIRAIVDGRSVDVRNGNAESRSRWSTVSLPPGKHRCTIQYAAGNSGAAWNGEADCWLLVRQMDPAREIRLRPTTAFSLRPMLPQAWADGTTHRTIHLGSAAIRIAAPGR